MQNSWTKLLLLFFSLGLAAWWSFTSLRPSYSSQPALDVWMLDVGQGESVLLREPSGKKLLFDGGPSDAILSQLGAVLSPWDKTIDLVVLSHNHSDHIRGIIEVLERYQVKEIWISGAIHTTDEYKTFLEDIKKTGLKPKVVYFHTEDCAVAIVCPEKVPFGDINLQVYHPLEDKTGLLPSDQHDATVMVKASYGQESLFLTGDVNEGHEEALLTACPPVKCTLASTILQEPHHGSATGLLPAFLTAVNPQAAFIPVGLANKFNHPAPSIISRLEEAKIPIYRTDTEGRIHAILYSDHFEVKIEGK